MWNEWAEIGSLSTRRLIMLMLILFMPLLTRSTHEEQNDELKRPFITFRDIQNAKKLAETLGDLDDAGGQDIMEFPWDETLLEGDIDLGGRPLESLVDSIGSLPVTGEDFVSQENAVAAKYKQWPNGIIPYSLSGEFDEHQRAVIALAMEEIQLLTCIRWLARRGTERDYITFLLGPTSRPTCRSSIGRNFGKQELVLSAPCFSKGIVMHEMMHAIGFLHEQSRNDRDLYVAIQWENLPGGRENRNFLTYGVDKIDNLDTNYDYSSLMHYPKIISGIEVIVPLIDVPVGQRSKFSDNDIYKINKLYQCLPEQELKPVCDPSIDCVARAQRGECNFNQETMLKECLKYCLLCHKGTKEKPVASTTMSTTNVKLSPTTILGPTPSMPSIVTPGSTNSETTAVNKDAGLDAAANGFRDGLLLRGVSTDSISCLFTQLPSFLAYQFFAAIDMAQYKGGEACGSCFQLTNSAEESLIVYIIDYCSTCDFGTFVASNSAHDQLVGNAQSPLRVLGAPGRITFKPLPCPDNYIQSTIKIFTQTGSNPFWAAFQPRSMRIPIVGMSFRQSAVSNGGAWIALPRCCGGGFFVASELPQPIFNGFQLKLESNYAEFGEVEVKKIILDMVGLRPGQLVETGMQN